MHEHRAVQPRQIYASTAHRRDRRRARRRGRTGVGLALIGAAMLLALMAIVVLAPQLG